LNGLEVRYVKSQAEAESAECRLLITNYERVRDGDINPAYFIAASLDEASVLRSYGSKTYQEFLSKFAAVKYRLLLRLRQARTNTKNLFTTPGSSASWIPDRP
jgi:hypothetical protein